jgi:hypothetical protein
MTTDASAMRLRHLLAQAKAKMLYVSPPYSDPRAQEAFLSGYHACLSDIANGDLDVSEGK